jgi:hypothetical protein
MFLQMFTRISPLISTESYYLIFAELFSFTELPEHIKPCHRINTKHNKMYGSITSETLHVNIVIACLKLLDDYYGEKAV